jgi:hypothetical protein
VSVFFSPAMSTCVQAAFLGACQQLVVLLVEDYGHIPLCTVDVGAFVKRLLVAEVRVILLP